MKIKTISIAIMLSAIVAVSAQAQTTRTTPVEVKNSVSIDQSGNTVNAQQSGAWNVGVTGTPNVNVSNTPSVAVTNIPNVILTNSPTVKIDSANNMVKAPTQSSFFALWSTNQSIGKYGYLWRYSIDCAGFKEARFFIKLDTICDYTKVKTGVEAYTPNNLFAFIGACDFAPPANALCNQANFTSGSGTCVFTVPVISNTMAIYIYNGNLDSITIDGSRSWVYLVN